MPVNRNALIRYKTIDNCLRNRYKKWTLEDLIHECSETLYEYEGIDKGVSRRTVQMDLQLMCSEKLGYNAPIVVTDKKFYSYSDPEYSITNIPLTDQDLNKLTEVVDILKQFKGFSHFKELSGMVQKLEDKVHTSKTKQRSIIDLEKNEDLRGLEFIDPIYKSILNKKAIEITYQSFKARSESTFTFHPHLLKEHRNRWFILGNKKKDHAMVLALDRVLSLKTTEKELLHYSEDKFNNYFDHVIGVSVSENLEPIEVVFFAPHSNAPYISTKPLHQSQVEVTRTDEGVYFSMFVQHNFELERDLLAFGDRVKVISPPKLRAIIRERLLFAYDQYETELNENSIKHYPNHLNAKGSIIVNRIFTQKSLKQIKQLLFQFQKNHPELQNERMFAIRELFSKIPELQDLCINSNIKRILSQFGNDYFLTKAIFFDKPKNSNWYVTWHQDVPINVQEKIITAGYSGWTKKNELISVMPPEDILHQTITIRIHIDDTTSENGALKVLPGSHKKRLTDEEIKLITNSSIASNCEVMEGGIHIMKPLLLHSSSKSTNKNKRRVIHLEFNNQELEGEIEWSEKIIFKNNSSI
jgi:predicted DNA-binding transcriptional regulator YafY/ectoine hydroxylase-related dioxygenase (phytanoyl-CoA dioxygenase family)